MFKAPGLLFYSEQADVWEGGLPVITENNSVMSLCVADTEAVRALVVALLFTCVSDFVGAPNIEFRFGPVESFCPRNSVFSRIERIVLFLSFGHGFVAECCTGGHQLISSSFLCPHVPTCRVC